MTAKSSPIDAAPAELDLILRRRRYKDFAPTELSSDPLMGKPEGCLPLPGHLGLLALRFQILLGNDGGDIL